MQHTMMSIGATVLLAAGCAWAAGEGAKPAASLEACVVMKTTSFTLPAETRGAAFREAAKKAAKEGSAAATVPTVNAELRIRNTGKDPVTLKLGGDESTISLELSGPGAVNVELMMPMSMEFRFGQAVTIRPGAEHVIPLPTLRSGMRGVVRAAWWTEPGDYELGAQLHCMLDRAGGEPVGIDLTAKPAKFTVTAP